MVARGSRLEESTVRENYETSVNYPARDAPQCVF
jgi:hypothetical protein